VVCDEKGISGSKRMRKAGRLIKSSHAGGENLRLLAARGARWNVISDSLTGILQLAQLAVLSRLLSPSDFGLMAMVMTTIGFGQFFIDAGMSYGIIYRQEDDHDRLSSLYWMNIMSGVSVFIIILLARPAVVSLFNEPRLYTPITFSALVFLIAPIGQLFEVLFEKEFEFKTLAIARIVSSLIGAAIGISLAASGLGVLALVFGEIARVGIRRGLLAMVGWMKWPIQFRFQPTDLSRYLGFGLYQIGERILSFASQRLDTLLIGALLGAETLGYYNVAWTIVMTPYQRLNPIIGRVAIPYLARIRGVRHRMKCAYLRIINLLSLVNFPILLGLSAVAGRLAPVFLGSGWSNISGLMRILAIVALLRSVLNPVGSLLLANGRVDLGFAWNVVAIPLRGISLLFAARIGGIIEVAWALFLIELILGILGYYMLIRRLIGPCLRDYLLSFSEPLTLSIAMAAFVSYVGGFISLDPLVSLILLLTLGILTYISLIWIFYRRTALEHLRSALGA